MMTDEIEIWKDVIGFEGLYLVSSKGQVRSLAKTWIAGKGTVHCHLGKTLKQSSSKKGYLRVSLCKGGVIVCRQVHRLVAQAFIPNPENKPEVNHKYGNTSDNSVSQLEWATSSENTIHAFATGLMKNKRGKDHYAFNKRGSEVASSKIVLDVQTGIFYESAKDAAKSKGMKYKSFSNQLTGHRANKTSMIYV